MRLSTLLTLLAVGTFAAACSRSEARTTADLADPSAGVSDTVRAGRDFTLYFPGRESARACIQIPADAVPAGTVISITPVTESPMAVAGDFPPRFQKAVGRGLEVFPPVLEISADREVAIADTANYYTVGLCVFHDADDPAFAKARLAHDAPGDSGEIEYLRLADPCPLVCPASRAHYAKGGGSGGFIDVDGLGGKGGSLSPFAAVETP